jgi:hypothetical protein
MERESDVANNEPVETVWDNPRNTTARSDVERQMGVEGVEDAAEDHPADLDDDILHPSVNSTY